MLDSAETTVADFIRVHGLYAEAKGVLLAVSGGADSIALLHILERLQAQGFLDARLVCAHVNHQLRGSASDEDERLVLEQTTTLGLPVATTRVDVRAHAGTHRLSLETAARELRLDALSRMARDHGCTWVATGHQKNDNAETIVHRLRRGTGLRGLAGIRPARQFSENLWLASPLLCLTRDDILAYLGRHGLAWREDHTNLDTACTRNYVRHRLLPALQRESTHSIVDELCDLAAGAGRLYDRIGREADTAKARITTHAEDKITINAASLAALFEPVAIEVIRLALTSLGCGERDLTEYHYRGVLRLARDPTDAKGLSLPDGFVARRERDTVSIGKARSADKPVTGIDPVTLSIPGVTQIGGLEIHARILARDQIPSQQIERDKDHLIEYFDLDRMSPPVVVGPRRTGDRFQPLGAAVERKVGKFLTAAKVPHDRRGRILIVADRERIVWVCPVRMSEWVKVTENTQQVLELRVVGR